MRAAKSEKRSGARVQTITIHSVKGTRGQQHHSLIFFEMFHDCLHNPLTGRFVTAMWQPEANSVGQARQICFWLTARHLPDEVIGGRVEHAGYAVALAENNFVIFRNVGFKNCFRGGTAPREYSLIIISSQD
jgi:hypothetical protein